MTVDISQREYFEDLYQQGRHAIDRGELERALEIYDQALRWAEEWGERDDVDRASCSRLAVLLHTGQGEMASRSLRMILMRSSNALNQFIAAYNIAMHYENAGDFSKSQFYGDLALDHANRLGSEDSRADFHRANCYCHLGNLAIRESRFSEALGHYERAADLYDEDEVYRRLGTLTSMGFCHLAGERLSAGFALLFRVRRAYVRLRLGPSIAAGRLRLAFCFGYVQLEKFHQAVLHGKEAIRIGEECGDRDVVKKALYLLGEAEKIRGDEMEAFKYFANLQEDYYPDHPNLPEILLYNDTNRLVNVWA
jgi:tetratricopeptide (TPR) repeat protein